MLDILNIIMTGISLILNSTPVFGIVLVILVLLGEKRNSKRAKIAIAIFIALIIGFALKEMYKVPRPCITEPGGVTCPNDYSFPSLHAIGAFALMIPFINKEKFAYYLLFALLTAFTRIYLGVHTIEDIAAGLVVASISCYAIDRLFPKGEKD